MEYKRFGNQIVVRLDDGDEIISSLKEICAQAGVVSGNISGIGATQKMRLRVADFENDGFVFQDFHESMEITSLAGNITQAGQEVSIHLHGTAADREMHLHGGHIVSCTTSATAEIFITVLRGRIQREASGPTGTIKFG